MKLASLLIVGLALNASTLLAQGTTAKAPVAGTYAGQGEWVSQDGQKGHYLVTTTVMDGVMKSSYKWAEQGSEWTFTMLPFGDNFFKVASGADGQIVGEGYCFDVQCHYTAFGGNLEETLSFVDGKLYKLGSKKEQSLNIKYQEALTLSAP
jgi:hypothetical protein